MNCHAFILPRDLTPADITGRCVVVFDVLRATSVMTAALAVDVSEIRIFDDPDKALAAAKQFSGPHLVCGEVNSLPPPGFDLGNSPRQFKRELHAGKTLFMSTTNGTRAIVAAQGARQLLIGSILNATSVAAAAARTGLDITLLCSGTKGTPSIEDMLGVGAVLNELVGHHGAQVVGDVPWIALHLFQSRREQLQQTMHEGWGGHNVVAAGLQPDIAFAARLNAIPVVGVLREDPLAVHRLV